MKGIQRFLPILSLVLFAAILPAMAQSANPGPPPPPMGMGNIMHIMHGLDLTEAQRTSIHSVFHKYMDGDLGKAMQAMGDAHHQLEKLVWDPAATAQDLTKATQAISTAVGQTVQIQHQMALEIGNLLTDDQRQKLQTLLSQPAKDHGHMGDMHGEHHPPAQEQ